MKLTSAERTKLARRVLLNRGAKFLRQPGRPESREGQMRRKRPLFPRDAKSFRGLVDSGREGLQIPRSLDARPENARMFFVGEKAQTAKPESNRSIDAHGGERAPNC